MNISSSEYIDRLENLTVIELRQKTDTIVFNLGSLGIACEMVVCLGNEIGKVLNTFPETDVVLEITEAVDDVTFLGTNYSNIFKTLFNQCDDEKEIVAEIRNSDAARLVAGAEAIESISDNILKALSNFSETDTVADIKDAVINLAVLGRFLTVSLFAILENPYGYQD